jgi:prolyl-tRNA synthetase
MADSGSIGGNTSHEFHVLADSGEDAIAFSDGSDYAANIERAETLDQRQERPAPSMDLRTVPTPGVKTIADLCAALDVTAQQTLKTLLVQAAEGGLAALVLRGDHELNAIKAEKHPTIASPLRMASEEEIEAACGARPGSIGPIGLSLPVIADFAALAIADFYCGANRTEEHLAGANWDRDIQDYQGADLRSVVAGDPSPDGQGTLQICRGIEVGHIFQLGSKYSDAMGARVLEETGRNVTLSMGCYGIGVSRIVAAAIEQNHDERGICWPRAMAPFQLALVPLNMHKSQAVAEAAEKLHTQCIERGIEVLLDDRNERPGVKFADMELLGIPHRVVIGDRSLAEGEIEYQGRQDTESQRIALGDAMDFIDSLLNAGT